MNKLKTLIRAPALTRSGYGVHSRQLIFALLKNPLLDIFVESVPWGNCAFLSDESQETQTLKQLSNRYLAAKQQGQDKDFQLFISVTIPQEFERRGIVNIGVTAAAETDRCSAQWIQKCNEMDLIVVPSKHSQLNLAGTVYTGKDKETNQEQTVKLEKPCIVCPEGFDPKYFYKKTKLKTRVADLKFTADWNFLVVGQWGNGGFGEDRKNIANTIRYFIETFHGREDVGLVLKVTMGRSSAVDKNFITQRINAIKGNYAHVKCPPIHLVHENLTDEEMADLYNHPQIKSMISLTAGEGFGLPLLEAAACELPIIATNWSGHLDFLTANGKKCFSAVNYELKEIPDASVWEPVLVKGSRWAVADQADAKRRMRQMTESYSQPRQWAQTLAEHVGQNFDLITTQKSFSDAVNTIISQYAQANPDPLQLVKSYIEDEEAYNILYTMPMSTGDVFVSTAVIDGVIKSIKEEYATNNVKRKISLYFATQDQYKDILDGNPNIEKVIPWHECMMNVAQMDEIFDLVLTPNASTQFVFSNWVRGGNGRLLLEEFANHCQVEPGNYFIAKDPSIVKQLPEYYVTFHPGSGKGQWEARNYNDWQDVLNNLSRMFPALPIVQVGGLDEPAYDEVEIDLRGKTTVHQLASIIEGSVLHICIDTFTMHLAAAFRTPLVAIFGSSHAGSTGPWYKTPNNEAFILLEAQNKMGCKKACYKYQCKVNPSSPCVNEISAQQIVESCAALVKKTFKLAPKAHKFTPIFPKLSGYTTCYNGISMGYPFVESIVSMLGFCDEVVVVDHSTDGTYEILEKMAKDEPRIQLVQREWVKDNPTQDGDAKAFARSLCQYEYCWQFDLDEVVHERDYEKIKWITKRFPGQADILHLPVIECWGDDKHATGRRHPWKWRLSRNKPNITHGVNKYARLVDEKTGKVYAKEGMSDSCEYIDSATYEPLPHTGFYTPQLEQIRTQDPEQFEKVMAMVVEQIPSIYHYSWRSLFLKVKQFQTNWDRQWSVLYQKQITPRFDPKEPVEKIVEKLYEKGGEENDEVKYKYVLKHEHPTIMKDWLTLNKQETACG